ncbi:restriction endonuclease subunit S [Deinococcus sp. SDU3-2]|uniref:Restriction endonuclease subunit S n=1 Tax=Deinococcus terrestris TaxID=2651870 RepID=A0A7X1NYI7_9DEIO|nr:restriction endonuclease subunit S [Deinococcus terrestris]MPY68138.1 restriction endonuclease subunit S [Deinococcus terrestris]
MTKTTKQVPAPRLRFPGFVGKWEEKKLGELANLLAGATPSTSKKEYWGGDIPWMSSGDIHKKRVRDVQGRITELGYKSASTKMLPINSVLVALAGQGKTRGTVATNAIELCTNQSIAAIMPLEKLNYEFLYSFLDSKYEELRSLSTGEGGRGGLNLGILRDLHIPLPPTLSEQTRIAAALSSLDAIIAAHQSKQAALREHKRGLMAGLFPAEGGRVPRLRFPEFEGAGEWEEKKLGEISDIRTGPFGSVLHQEDYVTEGTPIVTVEHLGEFGLLGDNAPKVSDADKKRLSSYKIITGDIVFSRVGSVDRCSIARPKNDGWLFSGRLLRLRIINEREYTSEFLNQLLKIESSKSKIRNAAVGQTMASLNTEILKRIAFLFPSLPEQTRIAAALSSLDDLIAAQGDHIAALQAFKRGLMQGLFPAASADNHTTQEAAE